MQPSFYFHLVQLSHNSWVNRYYVHDQSTDATIIIYNRVYLKSPDDLCQFKLISQVDYCASKFACVGLDEALRVELSVQVHYQHLKLGGNLSSGIGLGSSYQI